MSTSPSLPASKKRGGKRAEKSPVPETSFKELDEAIALSQNDGMRRAVLRRSLKFISRFIENASPEELERAVSSSSDYTLLLEELSKPENLEILQQEDPWAEFRLGANEAVEELLHARGGCVSVDRISAWLGITRQGVDRRRQRGQLIGLNIGRKGYAYPVWQFNNNRSVLKGLDKVLAQLKENECEGWDMLSFFLSPHLALSSLLPLDALKKGNVEGVVRAASMEGEQGAV